MNAPETSNSEIELEALKETVEVLKQRVKNLQGRRDTAFGVFEGMAHLEALVAERTEQLERAKQEVERRVEQRTRELREQTEELARANRLLHEMDRMKNHLLQNVSHELKTPLVSIRGYAELLRTRSADQFSKDQLEFLEIIVRNADHLNRVIEDLVQASQAAKGVSPLEQTVFVYNDLVQEVVQEMTPSAERYRIKLNVSNSKSDLCVSGDRRQLRQMLLNLLSNAIKFTADQDTRQINVAVKKKGDAVETTVADTGIGIPKDKLQRIFERFYQVDPSATRKFGGMGIGLALVQEVIENHDGSMVVESEPNQGTKFVIQFPWVSQDQAQYLIDDPSDSASKTQVFVVEDQRESALFYHTAVEELGYTIESFIRPQDAVKEVVRKRPAVILLDLSMPGMSGIEFISQLHNRLELGADVANQMPRIILITARSRDEIERMQIVGSVDAILFKPFTLERLQSVLGRFIRPQRD